MVEKPELCAGCGKFTRSHNVAVDVSEYDEIGMPTLAGVVCHTCWIGDTDGVPAIEPMLDDHDRLRETLDTDNLVAVSVGVEELLS